MHFCQCAPSPCVDGLFRVNCVVRNGNGNGAKEDFSAKLRAKNAERWKVVYNVTDVNVRNDLYFRGRFWSDGPMYMRHLWRSGTDITVVYEKRNSIFWKNWERCAYRMTSLIAFGLVGFLSAREIAGRRGRRDEWGNDVGQNGGAHQRRT